MIANKNIKCSVNVIFYIETSNFWFELRDKSETIMSTKSSDNIRYSLCITNV